MNEGDWDEGDRVAFSSGAVLDVGLAWRMLTYILEFRIRYRSDLLRVSSISWCVFDSTRYESVSPPVGQITFGVPSVRRHLMKDMGLKFLRSNFWRSR